MVKKVSSPLVSCLCVTSNRVSKLEICIRNFFEQTYKKSELVLVYKRSDKNTRDFLNTFESPRIKKVQVDDNLSLGDVRNISLKEANGSYFCVWDDDDWFHKDRIKVQLTEALKNHQDGSVLTSIILFDQLSSKAYLSPMRAWENTILFKKVDADLVKYPSLNKREDTAFTRKLIAKRKLFPITLPLLYIYVSHGTNTCDESHFKDIFSTSQELSDKSSRKISAIVHNKYSSTKAKLSLAEKSFLKELNFFENWIK